MNSTSAWTTARKEPELLDWLNALPEVHQVLKVHFDGMPASKQNLSEWRQGGFQEWLLRREFAAQAQAMEESCDEVEAISPPGRMLDAAAMALATRFASLLIHWNGEVDDSTEARGRFLNAVCRSVVSLQRSARQARQDQGGERQPIAVKPAATQATIEKRPSTEANPLPANRMSPLPKPAFNPVPLPSVKPGQTRFLTPVEMTKLWESKQQCAAVGGA